MLKDISREKLQGPLNKSSKEIPSSLLPSIRKGKREEDRDGLGRRGRLDKKKTNVQYRSKVKETSVNCFQDYYQSAALRNLPICAWLLNSLLNRKSLFSW